MLRRFAAFGIVLCGTLFAFAAPAHAAGMFENEEIKPYIKLMPGPWQGNSVSGSDGTYRIHVQMPRTAKYALGLFDTKINRTGADERSAVVLVDGVNPLVPSETAPLNSIDSADVSQFRKYPFDGTTFTARDTSGKDAFVKVVDAKEEWEVGAVRPLEIPAGRSGANLGRIDIFIFAGPAQPPVAGGTVSYGRPLTRFTVLLGE